MRGQRFGYGITTLIPMALIGLFLAVWLIPSGPGISGGFGPSSFKEGYVGDHYSVWTGFTIRHSFVVEAAQVTTSSTDCLGTIRVVGEPVQGGYLDGVSTGPLPGASVIGRRLTPQLGRRLAIVLTPSRNGECRAITTRFAAHSWVRTRWTTLSTGFSVDVTHRTGQDPRSKGASTPPL